MEPEAKKLTQEELIEQEEEQRLGPPDFGELYAGQVQDLEVPFFALVKGQRALNTVIVKRMNDDEMERYQNAGKEVNLREDRDSVSGIKVQTVRDISESKAVLFKYAIRDFTLASGALDAEGNPVFHKYADLPADKRSAVLRQLDPPIANYIADKCRAHNGLGLSGNAGGGEPSSAS